MADGTKKKAAKKSSPSATRDVKEAGEISGKAAPVPAQQKLHSPIVPLLWLLIPFVGVIVYAYITGE
jgi:hypothetical protein